MGNPHGCRIDEIVADLPIGDIAAKLGVDEATARKAVDDALPALLAGMGANATDPAGAASLERAVKSHDPSLVEGGVNLADVDEEDGRKIVKNVFGDNTDQVVTALDKKEGGARRPHRQAPADPRADRARVPREAVHEEAGGLGAARRSPRAAASATCSAGCSAAASGGSAAPAAAAAASATCSAGCSAAAAPAAPAVGRRSRRPAGRAARRRQALTTGHDDGTTDAAAPRAPRASVAVMLAVMGSIGSSEPTPRRREAAA